MRGAIAHTLSSLSLRPSDHHDHWKKILYLVRHHDLDQWKKHWVENYCGQAMVVSAFAGASLVNCYAVLEQVVGVR